MTNISNAFNRYITKKAIIERYLPPIIDKKSKEDKLTEYFLSGGAVGTGLGILKGLATGNPAQIPMGFVAGSLTGAGLELTDRYRDLIGDILSSEKNKYANVIGGAALGTGIGLLTGIISAPFVGPIAIPVYTIGDALIGAVGSRNIVEFVNDVAKYIKRTGRSIEDYIFEKSKRKKRKKK